MGYADFDDPKRAITTGRHTSIETWEDTCKRSSHGRALYGWMWVEYQEDLVGKLVPARQRRIKEIVLRCQRPWSLARIQAEKEHGGIVAMVSYAACCERLNYVLDDHLKTVRHFRYWCLQFPELALRAWPWMKDLMAEAILTHEERA